MARRERLLRGRVPLQERSRRRVDAILDALALLLDERGFEGVTKSGDRRERAGIPIGSVYHFFPSKEGILAELASRKFQAVDAALTSTLARDLERQPWRPALERAIEAAVAAFRSDPAYVTVWRAMRSSPSFRAAAVASDQRPAQASQALPLIKALPPAQPLRDGAHGDPLWATRSSTGSSRRANPREAAGIVRG